MLVQVDSYVMTKVVRQLNNSTSLIFQGIWTARELTMTDLRRGSVTRLSLDKIDKRPAERRDLHPAGDPPPVRRAVVALALVVASSALSSSLVDAQRSLSEGLSRAARRVSGNDADR